MLKSPRVLPLEESSCVYVGSDRGCNITQTALYSVKSKLSLVTITAYLIGYLTVFVFMKFVTVLDYVCETLICAHVHLGSLAGLILLSNIYVLYT